MGVSYEGGTPVCSCGWGGAGFRTTNAPVSSGRENKGSGFTGEGRFAVVRGASHLHLAPCVHPKNSRSSRPETLNSEPETLNTVGIRGMRMVAAGRSVPLAEGEALHLQRRSGPCCRRRRAQPLVGASERERAIVYVCVCVCVCVCGRDI